MGAKGRQDNATIQAFQPRCHIYHHPAFRSLLSHRKICADGDAEVNVITLDDFVKEQGIDRVT